MKIGKRSTKFKYWEYLILELSVDIGDPQFYVFFSPK